VDTRDDDIEFDFFDDEPATTEAQTPSRVRLPRRETECSSVIESEPAWEAMIPTETICYVGQAQGWIPSAISGALRRPGKSLP